MQVNTHHSESRETEEIRKKNPWWIPRFIFGSIPVLESRKVTLLGCVTIAILYENYDISLLLTTLEKISLGLDIDETQLGYFVSQIRFGGLFSLLVIPFADIFGRRRLMLLSIICLSLGTCATAFSQTPGQFVFLQVFTRTFILTAAAIAIVLISEEFPARHRGWAFGILGAGAAVGYFFGALFFAAVDWFPYGWRALYFIGIIPLFRMPMFRGGIYETKRFREYRGAHRFLNFQHAWRSWFGPYARLGRTYPWRVGGLALMGMLSAGGFITVISFIGYYLLAYRDFQSWQLSTVLILCGSFLIPGNVLAGRLADLIGRKKTGFFYLTIFPPATWLFFMGSGILSYLGLILLIASAMAGTLIIRALSTELVPTSSGGTSAGLITIMETVGAGLGLMLMGAMMGNKGDLVVMVPLVSSVTFISAFILLLFPETGRRELEELSGRPLEDN